MYPKDSRANPKSVQELRTLAAELHEQADDYDPSAGNSDYF
jgi:hypothetical protein